MINDGNVVLNVQALNNQLDKDIAELQSQFQCEQHIAQQQLQVLERQLLQYENMQYAAERPHEESNLVTEVPQPQCDNVEDPFADNDEVKALNEQISILRMIHSDRALQLEHLQSQLKKSSK